MTKILRHLLKKTIVSLLVSIVLVISHSMLLASTCPTDNRTTVIPTFQTETRQGAFTLDLSSTANYTNLWIVAINSDTTHILPPIQESINDHTFPIGTYQFIFEDAASSPFPCISDTTYVDIQGKLCDTSLTITDTLAAYINYPVALNTFEAHTQIITTQIGDGLIDIAKCFNHDFSTSYTNCQNIPLGDTAINVVTSIKVKDTALSFKFIAVMDLLHTGGNTIINDTFGEFKVLGIPIIDSFSKTPTQSINSALGNNYIDIKANARTHDTIYYNWTGQGLSNETTDSIRVFNQGNYTLNTTNGIGCTYSDTVFAYDCNSHYVNITPIIHVTNETDSNGVIQMATEFGGAFTINNLLWQNPITSLWDTIIADSTLPHNRDTIGGLKSGNYILQLTDTVLCSPSNKAFTMPYCKAKKDLDYLFYVTHDISSSTGIVEFLDESFTTGVLSNPNNGNVMVGNSRLIENLPYGENNFDLEANGCNYTDTVFMPYQICAHDSTSFSFNLVSNYSNAGPIAITNSEKAIVTFHDLPQGLTISSAIDNGAADSTINDTLFWFLQPLGFSNLSDVTFHIKATPAYTRGLIEDTIKYSITYIQNTTDTSYYNFPSHITSINDVTYNSSNLTFPYPNNNGNIILNLTSDLPLTYEWDGPISLPSSNSVSIDTGGQYRVLIKDQQYNGCQIRDTFELNDCRFIDMDININNSPTSTLASDGSLLFTLNNTSGYGTGNSFDNFVIYQQSTPNNILRGFFNTNTQTINNLSVNNYPFILIDTVSSCTYNYPFSVVACPSTTLETNITPYLPKAKKPNGDIRAKQYGAIQLSVIGDPTPYNFTWAHGETGASLTNLYPNAYFVTYQRQDGACEAEQAVIDIPFSICKGHTLANGVTPFYDTLQRHVDKYIYNHNNAQVVNPNALTFNTMNHTTNSSIILNDLQIANISASEANSTGSSIDVSLPYLTRINSKESSPGNPIPYSGNEGNIYVFINGSHSSFDAKGNSITFIAYGRDTFKISSTPSLSLSQTPINNGNDGTATVSISGGVPPYTYAWNNNAGSSSTATNLSDTTYRVTVTDGSGCEVTDSIAIDTCDMGVSIATTGVTNSILHNALVAAAVSGSTIVYPVTYVWTDYVTGDTVGFGPVLGNVGYGSIQVTATDATGCSAWDTLSIIEGENYQDDIKNVYLSPNPSNGPVLLSAQTSQAIDLTITVFNALGQQVLTTNTPIGLTHQSTLDLSSYSNGVYLIQISAGNATHTAKLIKETD